MFIGPAAEGDFMILQRGFYHKYGEHNKLSQYVWEAMHIMFHLASTSSIVSQLPIGENE